MLGADEALQVRDFLGAANQKPLPMLHRANEFGSLEQRVVGASVEPGIAAAKFHDIDLVELQIMPIDVGDFQFAPR